MVRPYKLFGVLAGLCLLTATALAQVKSSAITGTVTDPSGAGVPQAAITVVNEATNVSAQTETSSAGDYTVPYLPVGRYTLIVKAAGFQAYRKTGITIASATTVRADAPLTVGSVSTTVQVTASAAALQTESATVQNTVPQQLIAELPNINNNPLYYSTLTAGVVATPMFYNSHALGVGYTDRQQMSATRINGGPLGTNDVQLDGVSVQGAAWHEIAVLPDRDSLQEVRVSTNTFSADTGDGQGLISLTTKSGSNALHGTLGYRLRNEALNANGFYNNAYDIKRSKYRVNEYTGNIGGPVIIPKLFDGKDKLFFFASYSRLTHQDPDNYLGTVPTTLQRVGDFSQTMVQGNDGEPVNVNIYNPYSATPYEGSSTIVVRQQYPNNIIPSPDAYGLKILQAYPAPNHTPTNAYGANNYEFNGTIPVVRNSWATRVDYRAGAKNSLYFSGGESIGSSTPPNLWGKSPFVNMNYSGVTADTNPYGALGDTITVNPTTVIDIRYGVTHIHTNDSIPTGTGFDYSDYGMPANVQSLVAMAGTATSIGGFNEWTELNNDSWLRKQEHQLNHVATGSITKVQGRWTFKAGGEYRVYLGNWQDLEYATPAIGVWQQGNTATGEFGDIYGNNSSLITNPADGGASGAIVLSGATGYFLTSGTTAKPALAAKYGALYSQNDWKVNRKLTINLGVRYEVQPGPTERYNRISAYDLTKVNSYVTGVSGLSNPSPLAGYGLVVFPGQNGLPRNLWTTSWDNISPRLGAAYAVSKSTVLRAGFGRIYVPSNTGFNANGSFYGTGPYSGGATQIPYGLTPTNGVPIGRFEDSQNTEIIPATGSIPAPSDYCCNGGWVLENNYKNGVTNQWNFFVQHQLGQTWLVSVGYVGSKGGDLNWHAFPVTGGWEIPSSTLGAWRNTWIASNGLSDPASATVATPMPALIGYAGGTTLSAATAAEPYLPLMGATYTATTASSHYNAMQVTVQHSLANGLLALINYTWSKSTGITGGSGGSTFAETQLGNSVNQTEGVDYLNLKNDSGLLGYDTPHRIVATLSYTLPFGRGKSLDLHNPVARDILGGWKIAPVITLESGMPWSPYCSGTMNARCFRVPGEPLEVPKSLQRWYNGATSVTLPDGRTITPAAYSFLKWNPDAFGQQVVQFPNGNYQVDEYQWGNTPMYEGDLRTPGFRNANLTLERDIQIRERVQMEFVAEATNLLNAVQFSSNAIQNTVGSVLTSGPISGTNLGLNNNAYFGSLNMSFMEPRQITLSLRVRF